MAVESYADRATMLADFGEAVAWTVGITTTSLVGVADTASLAMGGETGGALDRRLGVLINGDDLPIGATAGQGVMFRGVACRVKAIEPDGSGMVLVRLEEVVADL